MYRVKPDKIKELGKFGFVDISKNLVLEQYRRGMTFVFHNCKKASKLLNISIDELNKRRKKNKQCLIFEGAIVVSDGYYMENIIEDKTFAIQDLIKAGIDEEVNVSDSGTLEY